MFDAARQEGANQILSLARRVAAELSDATGRRVQVAGWIGSGGKMDWEYAVEIDGTGHALEVGDHQLLTFPRDQRMREEVEERIRYQMRSALEAADRSTPR
jgi:hypothetical protein